MTLRSQPSAVRRFRATIKKQGPNPYVDVPAAVSRAFTPFARSGRIAFEGKLNGAAVRGTLIPVRRGSHRLFVNGGMRSAAGVGVGDRVTFELRAMRADVVRTPPDLGRALDLKAGARAAFDRLPLSHRRELLRFIDDARSAETRRRRVTKTVAHVLGKSVPYAPRGGPRPLWTCPRCGNRFVNRNQYHSCKRHEIDEPFHGKPEHIRRLFDRFRAMVEACGPVTLVPYREKIGFMVRVRFTGAVPATRWLDVGLWLTRRVDHPRFRKIETLLPNAHVHLLRVTKIEELDREVAAWIKEAYEIGCQRHLAARSRSARQPASRGSQSKP